MNSMRLSQRVSGNEINNEIKSIFVEEFLESFHDILLISQKEFIQKYIHRLNIILTSYNQSVIPYLKSNKNIFKSLYSTIYEDYYLPIKFDCKSTLDSTKKETLKNFHPHCSSNKKALHTCQGVFYLVKDQISKNYKYVICSNCNYVYSIDCILMYCPECDCDYLSAYSDEDNQVYQPATWDHYHCGIMLNQQMTCLTCQDLLWLRGNKLFCKKCEKSLNPLDINWTCIMCKKIFNVKAKVYNPLEFKAMKLSVKNAIVNKMIIKPTTLPCKCDLNPLKLDFFHNSKCNGVLYEGDNFRKKIVVCSICKIFASVNKFKWICPICNTSFKTTYTRSFPSNQDDNKDEFTIDDKAEVGKTDNNNASNRNHKSINLMRSYERSHTVIEQKKSRAKECKKDLVFSPQKNMTNFKKQLSLHQSENLPISYRGVFHKTGDIEAGKKNLRMSLIEFPSKIINETSEFKFDEPNENDSNSKKMQKLQKNYKSASKPSNHVQLKSYAETESSLTSKKKRFNALDEDDFNFDVNDYNIITQLGQGTFGKIYLVEDKKNNVFCMKKIIINNKKNFSSLRNEYDIFRKYKHKNILSILGISEKKLDETTYSFYILMEVGKTDWEKEINQRQSKNNYYTEKELLNIIKQITSALAYLQKNNISHRDVKAQNVLVFEDNVYKIADFGEAKKFSNEGGVLSTLRGTELYMSPVLFNGLQNRTFDIKHNPYKSDVFSLGMCLLFAATLNIKILCRVRDFGDNTKLQIFLMNVISKKYSLGLVDLLIRMLSITEETRPDFIQLEEMLQ